MTGTKSMSALEVELESERCNFDKYGAFKAALQQDINKMSSDDPRRQKFVRRRDNLTALIHGVRRIMDDIEREMALSSLVP